MAFQVHEAANSLVWAAILMGGCVHELTTAPFMQTALIDTQLGDLKQLQFRLQTIDQVCIHACKRACACMRMLIQICLFLLLLLTNKK